MLGERVAHYEIVEQLGRGGMGVVYRATDTKLGRQVALKFLPDVDRSGERRARSVHARGAVGGGAQPPAHLHHLRDRRARRAGRSSRWSCSQGRTLADQIGGRPLPIGVSIDLALQIASALDVAHTSGIIHRDIKPANIFVTAVGLGQDPRLRPRQAPDADGAGGLARRRDRRPTRAT